MNYPDLDGNGTAHMHGIKGTWTNEAETWHNPSCTLDDVTGDDPDQGDPELTPSLVTPSVAPARVMMVMTLTTH